MTSQTPVNQVAIDPGEKYLRAWAGLQRLVREGHTFSGSERNGAYLNLGAQKAAGKVPGVDFANVSSVTGLDVPDDARAVCLTDWDGDGRQDLWIANRNAPRLRFFRNTHQQPGSWLQLRLRGTTCNRDAIGARVEVHAAGRLFIDTLRAGEGYLAQSSKVLHLGLGTAEKIEKLRVRWPGGTWEEFPGAICGARFLLTQGSSKAERVDKVPRAVKLKALPITPHPLTDLARVVVVDRPVMPRLPAKTWDTGAPVDLKAEGRPLLVLLWASWCAPCLAEMKELEAQRAKLGDLDVAAVCVDSVATSPDASIGKAKAMLKKTGFTATVYAGTEELLTRLDTVQQGVLNRWIALPVPCAFLLTRQHQLAFIYKGPVGVAQLRTDLDLLSAKPEALRRAAVPFEGRWLAPPLRPDPVRMASRFIENGYDDTAIEYLSDSLTTGERLEDTIRRKALVKLGSAYFRKGKRQLALPSFLEALRIDDRDHQTLNTVGVIYMEGGKLAEALPWYQRALEIDPLNTMARANLAITLHSLGRIAEAVPLYRENLRLRREWPIGANNLAWILATSPDDKLRNGPEALALAQKACASAAHKDPGYLATLAAAQAETGDFPAAIATSRLALQSVPPANQQLAESIAAARAAFEQKKPWRAP